MGLSWLCKWGFHAWEEKRAKVSRHYIRVCKRCPRVERWHMDGWRLES